MTLLLLVWGCGVTRVRYAKDNQSKTTQTKNAIPKAKKTKSTQSELSSNFVFDSNQSTAERIARYIEYFGPIAQKEMEAYHIPASITLAQGLLESGNGSGRLAREANNHFGIKCHGDWKGGRIYHDDDEKGECFRVYQNPKTSYRDHSLFLSQRQRYAFLFELNPNNYKAWARGLKKAGYATDPKYPQKLISLIERYALSDFDKKVKLKKRSPNPAKAYIASDKEHQVQQGDTLYSIARQYDVPVSELIQLNKIENNTIFPGQLLRLPKLK